ncbi:MAG TPA: lysozyme inhibitor LprI family protein [Nitrososphaera sp.]|nr:lysozyme inhibitor LprI family protein [Nitrososphaera sp.]
MKQYIISFVLLIAALVAFPTSQVDAQTQAEMNAQARKDFDRVDAELNKIYQSLLAKLADTEAKNKLRESQRAWIAFRDAEAAFAADQFRGGSAAPVLRWTSMTETTEQRIKQLKADFPMAE